MISPADIAILGAVALMLFGPEKLPQVARKMGSVVREVQNTSQGFIREMERAADVHEDRARAQRYAAAPPAEMAPVTETLPRTDLPLGEAPPSLFDEPKKT